MFFLLVHTHTLISPNPLFFPFVHTPSLILSACSYPPQVLLSARPAYGILCGIQVFCRPKHTTWIPFLQMQLQMITGAGTDFSSPPTAHPPRSQHTLAFQFQSKVGRHRGGVEFLESARFRRSADGVFVECARADAAALYIACVSAILKSPNSHSPINALSFLFESTRRCKGSDSILVSSCY